MSDSYVRSRSDAVATRRWAERFKRFAASKQTVAAFCAAEGVAVGRGRASESRPPSNSIWNPLGFSCSAPLARERRGRSHWKELLGRDRK
jgi:hypothetical protein